MRTTWWAVALLVAGAVLYGTFVNDRLKFGGDAVEYYRLAESLRAGQGYTIEGQFNTKWPPVTPVLLWIGLTLFGPSVAGFKVMGAACALAGLCAAYGWLRRRADDARWALWTVTLSGVMFPFIYWTVDVSSEGPFFLLTMLALYCGSRLEEEPGRWSWAVGAGVATGLAILTRMVGITLLPALVLWAVTGRLRRRGPRPAAVAVALVLALAIAGAWFGYSRSQAGATGLGSYGSLAGRADIYESGPVTKSPVRLLVERAAANSLGYAFIFANPDASQRVKAQRRLTPLGLVSVGIMVLALTGFLHHLVRRPGLPEWYALCTGGLLLTYVWYDIRYVVPLFPLLFGYVIFSVGWIAGKLLKPRPATVATGVAVGLFILANVGFAVAGPQAKRLRAANYQGPAAEIHDAARWIQQTDPRAVIMCRWANMVWFWTRQPAVGVPLLADPEQMWQFIRAKRVDFVIADPDEFSGVTGRYLEPVLTRHADAVELAQQFGRTRVYRVTQ